MQLNVRFKNRDTFQLLQSLSSSMNMLLSNTSNTATVSIKHSKYRYHLSIDIYCCQKSFPSLSITFEIFPLEELSELIEKVNQFDSSSFLQFFADEEKSQIIISVLENQNASAYEALVSKKENTSSIETSNFLKLSFSGRKYFGELQHLLSIANIISCYGSNCSTSIKHTCDKKGVYLNLNLFRSTDIFCSINVSLVGRSINSQLLSQMSKLNYIYSVTTSSKMPLELYCIRNSDSCRYFITILVRHSGSISFQKALKRHCELLE